MTWQPIETAPKDGSWILVWCASSNVRDAAWCITPHYTGWVEDKNTVLPIKPTHWMPLPEPPK